MTATIGKPYSKYKDYAESYHVAGTRREDSQWRGKLAQKLGYDGEINQFAYDLASEGKDSYGRQLRKYQKNSRPAICDVTLNAPKSLSVEALVYSNPVAVAAHDFGVESALAFTEQHLLFSQVKRQGKVERVHTDSSLIGSFRQRDNREGEPHLHTHNVIFNVGWVEGKWRSLANEQIYLGKLTIGAIYQNDTAYHLHSAGYKTYWDANGQFELVGNPKRLLEQTFAQRTEKIEAYLAAQGFDRTTATPEQLNAANRATRNKKAYDKDATAQVLDWQATAATAGIKSCQRVSRQELESFFQAASIPVSPQEIVLAAAERLSSKRSSFGYMELVRSGCRLSAGKYLSSEVIKAIQQSRELIPVSSNTPYPTYTTRSILQCESQIIDWAIQGKSAYATISDSNKAAVAAEKFTLNSDQTLALQHIAKSQDLIILIQGSAGVGKTRSLSALLDLMSEHPIIGCAVGGLQAEALEVESGISSQTLESLIRTPRAEFPKDTLIVVDEAGVVSNRQMHCLIERAMSSNCRLLLVGDTKQLSAVETGNPFRLLQTQAGLETAFISQNMRQSDSQLKAVVNLCEEMRPDKAFDLLEKQGKISEIPDVDLLTEAIVDDYLTRPVEQRRNTLIMATTHKERAILTLAIRNKLIDLGELSSPALSIEVLQKKDLDKHHLRMADHYQLGDRVRFWRSCASFTKGELYRVSATNPIEHSVELVDTLGQTKTLDLNQYTQREVFSPQRISIAAGEEMRFTAGIKDKNGKQLQVNGQRFWVEAVDPVSQTVEISTKGKQFTVTPEDLLHSDYRWISTVHSLQGATTQYAIFADLQGNGALLSKESWYVAASRAKLEFAVYCSDSEQLRESIQRSIAQIPAIELIHPSISTSLQDLAVQAIVDYVQQQEDEAALTPELLKSLTQTRNQISSATKTKEQVNNVAFWGDQRQDTGQPNISTSLQDLAVQAIVDYVQQQEDEAALTPELLKSLTQTRNQISSATKTKEQVNNVAFWGDQRQDTGQPNISTSLQDLAVQAIVDYVQQQEDEAALTPELLKSLTETLHQISSATKTKEQVNNVAFWGDQRQDTGQPNISTSLQDLAVQAIVDYVQQQEDEAALTPELLKSLTETRNRLCEATKTTQQVLDVTVTRDRLQDLGQPDIFKSLQEKAVQAIFDYVQQQEIIAALTSVLLNPLTQTRNRLCEATKTTQQVNNVAFWDDRLQDLGQPDISKSLQEKAVQAIFDYVQQQEIIAALTSVLLNPLTEIRNQHNDRSGSVIAPTHKPPSPELLAAQFQILTDQLLAADAVYQEQGLRMERSSGQITAFREGNSLDLQKTENLVSLVNHLIALLQEFHPNLLYEEFKSAARLEKSIQYQANEIVKLNSGNYHEQGLSVAITGSEIEIQLDQNLVFKSSPDQIQRPDDLSLLSNLELQLQSTNASLQQTIAAQQQASFEALRLKALSETTNTSTIKKQHLSQGHGLTL